MRLELTGKGIDITAGIRQLVDKRLARIERLLGKAMISAQCVLSKQKYINRIDLTVHAAGDHVFHGAGEGRNWPAAMTMASDKVVHQTMTLKDKWKDKRAKGAKATSAAALRAGKAARAEQAEKPAESAARLRVRKLRYPVKPMTLDEAVALLTENGAEFLVFRNARSESVNVLVRRSDGNFGLIETEQ
jgi:putative sigma-54 modulation protein